MHDKKLQPSTIARSTNSILNNTLKVELRMRNASGSEAPMCCTVQWASTPIMTAHNRIRMAQAHSNFGCVTWAHLQQLCGLLQASVLAWNDLPGKLLASFSSSRIKLLLFLLLGLHVSHFHQTACPVHQKPRVEKILDTLNLGSFQLELGRLTSVHQLHYQ